MTFNVNYFLQDIFVYCKINCWYFSLKIFQWWYNVRNTNCYSFMWASRKFYQWRCNLLFSKLFVVHFKTYSFCITGVFRLTVYCVAKFPVGQCPVLSVQGRKYTCQRRDAYQSTWSCTAVELPSSCIGKHLCFFNCLQRCAIMTHHAWPYRRGR